ncbi:Sad1-interacting factor 3 [Hypoxylon texense]
MQSLLGNSTTIFIISQKGVILVNVTVALSGESLVYELMARWNAGIPWVEVVLIPLVLGIGQEAAMSGTLEYSGDCGSYNGIVTDTCFFIRAVGDSFGVAVFEAVLVNELARSPHCVSQRLLRAVMSAVRYTFQYLSV